MPPVTRPKARLPARIYWFRRGLVLVTALALVFGIAHLLGGGSSSTDVQATPSAAKSATSAPNTPQPTTPAATGATAATGPTKVGRTPVPAPTPLATPSGPCATNAVTVTPLLDQVAAGSEVQIPLQLTGTAPACTFKVGPASLVVRITSGSDRIWTTQDCHQAVSPREVVVRSGVPTPVTVAWSGRRSDEHCTASTKWALPGYYHLSAAVPGADPSDRQFKLTKPVRPLVVKTVKPHPKKKPGR